MGAYVAEAVPGCVDWGAGWLPVNRLVLEGERGAGEASSFEGDGGSNHRGYYC